MNTTTTMASKSAPIVIDEIKSKDRTKFGRVFPGEVAQGHHAIVQPGVSITLHGTVRDTKYHVDPVTGKWSAPSNDATVTYFRHFRLGESAVYGSYNLTYTGKITAITAKTVTIVEDCCGRETVHRLSIHEFDWRNWDYDVEETAKRNADWRD